MANPLFKTRRPVPRHPEAAPLTQNAAGGLAYRRSAEEGLAQLACAGFLGSTYYASAETQLTQILELAAQVEPEFLARTLIYARESGFLKDTPALLLAVLLTRNHAVFARAFPRVVDNGRMLRNFVQVIRSGRAGRKSLGTVAKRAIRGFFDSRTPEQLFRMSMGSEPRMADVIKLARPLGGGSDSARNAFYRYLLDKDYDVEQLPEVVQRYRRLLARNADGEIGTDIPYTGIPFEMLMGLKLGKNGWRQLARSMTFNQIRLNLNNFARNEVFMDQETVKYLAERMVDLEQIRRAKIFPYQIMTAIRYTDGATPALIKTALELMLDGATRNVPVFQSPPVVLLDVSGSMDSAVVTGARKGATSVVHALDAAALFAASIARTNQGSRIVPFDTSAHEFFFNAEESIADLTNKLSRYRGGGTDVSSGFRFLLDHDVRSDIVVVVSDNESWVTNTRHARSSLVEGTASSQLWARYRERNPNAKLINIDTAANDATTQVETSSETLNIAGFSDAVFEVIGAFVEQQGGTDYWVNRIKAIDL